MSTRFEVPRWRGTGRLLFAGVLVTALAVAVTEAGQEQAASALEPQAAQIPAPDVTLYPAQLKRGADTPLLHVEEEVIVDGDLRIPVTGPAHLWLMGRIGRDYLISTASADFRRHSVQLVRRNGERRVLQRFGGSTSATMSADGSKLALVRLARPDSRIRIVLTRSGRLVRERTFASYGVEVSDYGQTRLVLTGLRGRTYWWNPVRNRLTRIVPRPARADIAADRLVVLVPDRVSPYQDCQRTVRLSRPTEVLWRSCKDIPLTFSADASRMVTVDIRADGIGPGTVQVRRAGGKLLRTYRAPRWFGFTEWESDTDLLVQPVGRKYLAAVRCDLTDGCERASRLYKAPGAYDPPETMRWSFPQ